MAKKKIPELKIEPVADRGNILYLSLVEFKRETYLCVIDNVRPEEITAYVLDYAEQEGIDLQTFLSFTTHWFYARSEKVPISVALAKAGLTTWAAPMFRTFDAAYVSRIVGQTFSFEGEKKPKVRRRRVVPVAAGIEIKLKKPVTA